MKSLAELQARREQARAQMTGPDKGEGIRVVVGLATCGIAAGARPVLEAIADEIAGSKAENIAVSQTGCIGMCQFEPIVEVLEPGKEKVTYGKVDEEKARRIAKEHLLGGNPVAEYTIGFLMTHE